MADSKNKSYQDILDQILGVISGLQEQGIGEYNKKHGTNYTLGDIQNGILGTGIVNTNNPYTKGTDARGDQTNVAGMFIDKQGNAGTSFDDILMRFGGNSDFSQLLTSMGINLDDHLTTSQKQDWNKQLVDAMLQYYIQQEQRNYNKGVLDEQRQYDNPLNQLARLMATGMSRDAALQMISGGAGTGAGAGSALISDPMAAAQGLSPSQSKLNEIQGKTAIANTVFSGVQTLASLAGCGINIAQAIPATQILQAQAFMSNEQVNAYKAVKQVSDNAQNLINSGVVTYDQVKNSSDLEKYFNDNKTNPAIAPLFADGTFNAAFGSPLGRSMMTDHWSKVNGSRTDGQLVDEYLRGLVSTNNLTEAKIEEVGAELLNYYKDLEVKDSQIAKNMNDILVGNAQIQVLDAQGKWINVQTQHYGEYIQSVIDLNDANAGYANAQTTAQNLENELMQTGFDDLKAARLNELQLNALKWATMNSKTARGNLQSAWLKDSDNAKLAASLKHCYQTATLDFCREHPGLYKWLVGLDTGGLFDKINTATGTGAEVVGTLNKARQAAGTVGKAVAK